MTWARGTELSRANAGCRVDLPLGLPSELLRRPSYLQNGNMPKRKRVADRHAVREGADLASDASELITHLDRAMRQLVLAGEDDDAPMRFRRSEIVVIDTLEAEGP